MSYCKWRNTAIALRQCLDSEDDWQDEDEQDEISEEELRAKNEIISMCEELLDREGKLV